MHKKGWSGVVLSVVVLALSARAGLAQDTSKDEEIQDLKRRLEALEKDKQLRDQQSPDGAAVVSEPVEEKWFDKVHVGGGVRTEYRAMEEIPFGTTKKYTSNFTLDSGRLYTGGKINDIFSVTLNAEFTAAGASVLDAICQMKVADSFNIFMGRMLPATDRSNSDGPYYLSSWDFPFLSDGFNAAGKLGDRDDGITFWGDVSNFKYWVGVYEGADHGAPSVAFPNGDRLLYAARVQYNFFDPEPGYYLQSTYYGDKNILAIGLVANYQGGATVEPGGGATSFGNVAVDFLWEQKMAVLMDGTATVEMAYYYFGRHGIAAPPTGGGPAGPFDVGAGTGFLFSVAYLIPGHLGWGQFQPIFRYQGFDHSPSSANNPVAGDIAHYDFGVNYVMMGHNARISFVYTHIDAGNKAQFGEYVVGTQFQF
ncbi:MAG TPA: hypothetical protein VKW04_17760 [Planctomycetota bacterium]|nr:hypothetical protein [Planctomycetota bacterium]